MRLLPTLVLLSACWAAAERVNAADSPSGIVDQVTEAADGALVVVRFDAQAASTLVPGEMVALYAPGTVEKHPLTGQVITARPILAAKIQLTEVVGRIAGKVRWLAPKASVTTGMDAIPLPKEAAPNAAPALTAPAPKLSAAQGSAIVIQLPVSDFDKDPLITHWTLEGSSGHCGRLLARTTGGVASTWIAPLLPGELSAVARVRDPLGQEVNVTVALATMPGGSVAGRVLKPLARWGLGQEPALRRLERDVGGTWWGLSNTGMPVRIDAGWLIQEPLALPQDQRPKTGVALAVRGDEIHVLDAGRRQVVVYGTDSTVRRMYGNFDSPTDLALAPDGTAFIADQSAGGIEIIEPDGHYRGRLGRADSSDDRGDDGWQELVAISLDRSGNLYALDARHQRVVHFDRFQRRVAAWSVPAQSEDPPVDLAMHPTRGLLVLLASGKLVAVSSAGATDAAMPASPVGVTLGKAVGLAIDQLGDVITCHPESSALVRYDQKLVCTGVRTERTLTQNVWTADGNGTSYGLDQTTGMVTIYDPFGWAINRVDADAKGGGMFGATLNLAVDPTGARLWVSDSKKYGVHRLELERVATGSVIGGEGDNNGQFNEPIAVSCDDAGRVYLLDAGQYRVQVLDANGGFLFAFGQRGKNSNEFNDPLHVTVSPAGDVCYVYDAWSYEVKKFALDHPQKSAKHVTNGGGKGGGPGQFRKVSGLGCDRMGLLYALDTTREDLQVLDFRGASCVPLNGIPLADLDMPKATSLAVTPDGQVGLMGAGRVSWYRW